MNPHPHANPDFLRTLFGPDWQLRPVATQPQQLGTVIAIEPMAPEHVMPRMEQAIQTKVHELARIAVDTLFGGTGPEELVPLVAEKLMQPA